MVRVRVRVHVGHLPRAELRGELRLGASHLVRVRVGVRVRVRVSGQGQDQGQWSGFELGSVRLP